MISVFEKLRGCARRAVHAVAGTGAGARAGHGGEVATKVGYFVGVKSAKVLLEQMGT